MEFYIIEALLGALMFGIGGMLFKWNTHNNGDEVYFFLGLYFIGTICFLIEGFDRPEDADGVVYFLMAVIVALGSAGGNFAFSHGLRRGPAGLSSAFAKANVVIVILISSIYYGEALTMFELLGIGAFIAAMLIVNFKMGESKKHANRTWFFIMLVCMILIAFRNGGLKVANEMELVSPVVMALAYGFSALFFLARVISKRNMPWQAAVSKTKVLMMGCLTGTVSYAGLYFYIKALETGPGGVVVTVFSLDMLFVLIMSYMFFGERLNTNEKIGFILSAVGFVLIGLN